jgi:hypothetical protein
MVISAPARSHNPVFLFLRVPLGHLFRGCFFGDASALDISNARRFNVFSLDSHNPVFLFLRVPLGHLFGERRDLGNFLGAAIFLHEHVFL